MGTTSALLSCGDLSPQEDQSSGISGVGAAALTPGARRQFREGVELLNRGEAGQAAICFQRALAHAPDFADGHIGLGIAHAVESRVYPALDHFERAATLEPCNFYAHFKLAQLYLKLRVPQKGCAALARALECAGSLGERRLVAQVLREERRREAGGFPRPWWNRPFSRPALFLGASFAGALVLMLVFHLW